MTTQDKAKQALSFLAMGTRVGTNEKFVTQKDNAPDWMEDLCRNAHNDMLPDDYKYQFIKEALEALAEHEEIEDAINSVESDISTSDVLNWLASNNTRYYYVDTAIENVGRSESVITDILRGQYEEKIEVFNLVLESIENLEVDS